MGIESAVAAAVLGGVAAYGANEDAKAQKAGQSQALTAQVQAAGVAREQVKAQGDLEKQKNFDAAHRLRSTARVAAGEAGLGLSGSTNAILRQISFDAQANNIIINRNTNMGLARIQSGIQPVGPAIDPFTNALVAGMQGAGSGLAIGAQLSYANSPE